MGGAYQVSFIHIGHFNIPRPAVTFKQLLNCVFLFTIYVPHSPAPLPKLRLTRVCMREWSQPEGIPSWTEALTVVLAPWNNGLPGKFAHVLYYPIKIRLILFVCCFLRFVLPSVTITLHLNRFSQRVFRFDTELLQKHLCSNTAG